MSLGFIHNGLPRRDTPLDVVPYLPGQVGRVKPRAQVGYTNRREFHTMDMQPLLSSAPKNASMQLLNTTVERSKSSLSDAGRPVDVSATMNASAACPETLLESLHHRTQRSYTPEAFFFGSQLVGSGGQLVEDRSAVLRSRSVQSYRSSGGPTPLPDHQRVLSRLREVSSSLRPSQTPTPLIGSAGVLPPASNLDSSAMVLSRTAVSEPVVNRHLQATPINDFKFSTSSASEEKHLQRREHLDVSAKIDRDKHFFLSTSGLDNAANLPSCMPKIEFQKPKLRQELTDYHSTASVTQPPPNAGQYASESQRFAFGTRGLGSSVVPQSERAVTVLQQEYRAARRHHAEMRVLEAVEARDLAQPNRKENRISNQRAAAVAAWRIDRDKVDAAVRLQAETDARSEASLQRHKATHGESH